MRTSVSTRSGLRRGKGDQRLLAWDPKENWSLVTWLVYGAYLHLESLSARPTAGVAS
jgi:hypothetical protein